jgi:glucose/mannose-6-phosphate isomerase
LRVYYPMKELISNFPTQVLEAIQIGKKASAIVKIGKYNKVLISGLGGSGIGASIVADYCFDILSVPLVVNKGYFIPKNVDAETLFIACSYSGNTEETLHAATEAKKRKASIVCITSGGLLESFAKKHKLPLLSIPPGMPPRSCLGYSMVQLLFILKHSGVLKSHFEKELMDGLTLIAKENKNIHKEASSIAKKLLNKFVAIYANIGYEGLAVRYRQQLNENSKVLAWHNVIPEMTHNEIVGWKKKQEEVVVLFCYGKEDYAKNIKRLQYLKKVIKKYTSSSHDIIIKGNSFWQKALYFIHLSDWVSVYLADLNGNSTLEVKVIDQLKKEMSLK